MKCKKCGGILVYSDGVYTCENCGVSYGISDYYENIDAYICYIENDNRGVRTQDSVLAQEIFEVLESNKVSTFYSRISAADLTGTEFEETCNAALHASKVVLIVGTQKANFQHLLDKYGSFLKDKITLPVFSEINPYDIPKELSSIQALDYKKVGATTDLIKALLNVLGREKEIDYASISKKSSKKRRGLLAIITFCIGIIVFLSGAFLIHHNINNSDEAQYKKAVGCIEKEQYADAIEFLYSISDYKDSSALLLSLYEQYAGYYQDEQSGLSFHLQVWEGNTCTINISSITPSGVQCRISETSQFVGNSVNIHFNDSENNQGEVSLKLENQGFVLSIKTDEKASDVYIADCTIEFLIDNKSDKPFSPEINAEKLIGFIDKKTTKNDLLRSGYELILENNYESVQSWNVKNTDISLLLYPVDISNIDYESTIEKDDSYYVIAVFAPAEIVAPSIINQPNEAYISGDLIYVPDGKYVKSNRAIINFGDACLTSISSVSEKTVVAVADKKTVGSEYFEELIEYYIVEGKARRLYLESYPSATVLASIAEKDDEAYIVNVVSLQNSEVLSTYRVFRDTYKIEAIDKYLSPTDQDVLSEQVSSNDFNDDSPDPPSEEFNVWCPECGQGYFITGLGIEGLTCNECGCIWLPGCYICADESATGIKLPNSESFLCNSCGEVWTP